MHRALVPSHEGHNFFSHLLLCRSPLPVLVALRELFSKSRIAMSQTPVYQPPEWSSAPQPNLWRLSVLKGGVELEKLPLDAAFTIVGKQPGVCDIVLDHGECSAPGRSAYTQSTVSSLLTLLQRALADSTLPCNLATAENFIFATWDHPTVSHGVESRVVTRPWRPRASAGTRVNKQPAQPRSYTSLPVGSVIQFGASTRMFVVEGPDAFLPPEAETPELAALRIRSEVRQLRKASERAEGRAAAAAAEAAAGATWGLHEELSEALALARAAEADDSERATGRLPWLEALDLTALTENEHTLHDRLQKRLLKVRNLGAEARRLTAKAGGADGLSAGQASQLAKDEAAVEALLPLIEEDEEALRSRLVARGVIKAAPGAGGRGIAAHEVKLDDDEDVTDVTSRTAVAAAPTAKLRLVVRASRPGAAVGPGALARAAPVAPTQAASVAAVPAASFAAPLSAPGGSDARGTVHATDRSAAAPLSIGGRASSSRPVETLASLQEQLVRARARLLELEVEEKSAADLRGSAAASSSLGDDALDSYMAATAAALHEKSSAQHLAERRELEARLAHLDELLTAVGEAAGVQVDVADSGAAAPHALDSTITLVDASGTVGSKRRREDPSNGSAEAESATASLRPTDPPIRSLESGSRAAPARKTGPPPRSTVAATLQAVLQRNESHPPLASSSDASASARASASEPGRRKGPAVAKVAGGGFDGDEPEARWAPPPGQSGDGRTSLNDRLGY